MTSVQRNYRVGFAPQYSSAPKDYATSFNEFPPENPINQGGIWVRGATEGLDWTDPQTSYLGDGNSGAFATQIGPSAPPFNDSIAHLKNFAPDQYVKVIMDLGGGGTSDLEAELLLRFAITPHNARGYELDIVPTSGLHIVRWNGALNSYNDMTPGGIWTNLSFANGSVIEGWIQGNTITVKCNGNLVTTLNVQQWATNNGGAYFGGGNPGMGFWNMTGAITHNLAWRYFEAKEI